MRIVQRILLVLFVCAATLNADVTDYYKIETIETPKGLLAMCGGLNFLPNGDMVACFHRGEVYTYSLKTKQWKLFAQGLHEPLGVVALSNSELVIMQRPELTRVKDTDGDGVADHYQTISDDFGMTGNYHEFAFGPTRDKDGNFYVGLNVASNGASIRPEIRGEFRHYGITRDEFGTDWKKNRGRAGRMYAAAPYRGWIMKIAPDGTTTPFASGLRSPNGLAFDADGRLYVSDNQGDWVGTSKVFHIEEGKFYGHVASLVWRKNWPKGQNPLSMKQSDLDAIRTPAAIVFPHGYMANSPTEPFMDSTNGKFGPFAGQMFIGEMNRGRIIRMLIDTVDGVTQGSCIPFVDESGLRKGNNRFAFGPDNALYVGQTKLSWAGDIGIQRISWTGKTPFAVQSMKLTKIGFDLEFTLPVDKATASDVSNYPFKRYYYQYHVAYGSKQFDLQEFTPKSVSISADGKTVSVDLGDKMLAGRQFELNFKAIKAKDGTAPLNSLIVYTANRLKK